MSRERLAVVTGASSGIGRALAIRLSQHGFSTVLTARRIAGLAQTHAALNPGSTGHLVPADLTSAEDRQRLVDEIGQLSPRVDLLALNAGVVPVGAFADMDPATMEEAVATNLVAPMLTVRALLPALKRAAPSQILLVGSMFGHIGFPMFAAYSASKYGLRGLADALRRELAADSIGILHVAPRATRTGATAGYAHLVGPFGMKIDTAERVADTAVRAALRGQRDVLPGRMERVFVGLQAMLPQAVDRALIGQLRRMKETQARAETPASTAG